LAVEFRILGPLELSAEGRVLPLGSQKQRALLGLLLVHANEVISRDRLIEELWAEAAPASVASALHVYLSRLRRLLDSAGAGDALVREAQGYRLRVEPEQLDANRFERLVGEGSAALAAGNAKMAADRFREALAFWRGQALADLQSERFAITAAARLEERRVFAFEQQLDANLALGRDRELIGELEMLVADHPYRERLRGQLMLALYRSGRQAEALRAYQDARHTLADELGLEPSHELKQLEQAILRQDAMLTLDGPANLGVEPKPMPTAPAEVPPPREERKVVTVLFADLVAFSAQADQLDPEDVRSIQDRQWAPVRAEIERHGGTVEKFVGDAVMALFGAPRTHEDDPERAVRAALAIRDWVREQGLEVRVAVTTGEALVRLGAQPLAGEGMAAGDVVNAAARLQAAAPVNGILVGERTLRATEHVIDYGERRPVQVKGRSETIPVWEALRARPRVGGDVSHYAATPLVGRGRELELLRSTLARACSERVPQLVTLIGVPGIGKSRLVSELRELAADVTWRQGRCLPYGDGISFWALAEIVKAQVGVLETDSATQAEQRLRQAAPEHWVQAHLRRLVGLGIDGFAEDDRREEAFAAWRHFLEAVAGHAPLALVFEDLHWADDGLLDFVDYLVEWASAVPLLVVCTARPELLERRSGWGGGKPNAITVSPPPLSDEETARLVSALLERPGLPAERQASLLRRATGNPLFAEQFARMVNERIGDDEPALPETVQGVIAARLDLLEPEQKALLQDGAVLGKVFWLDGLISVSGSERRRAEAILHALERRGFVRREHASSIEGDTEYAFLHVLVREVAEGQMPRAGRAEKHRLAAEWIESLGRREDHAEMLAHHYGEALALARAAGAEAGALVESARRAFRDAGDRAIALHAYSSAARFYEQAVELWPEDEHERPRLLLRHARAVFVGVDSGRLDLLEAARDALLAVGEREGAAEAEMLAAFALRSGGRDLDALERAHSAAALVAERRSGAAKGYVLANLARLLAVIAQRNVEAIELAGVALAIADELSLGELKAHALNTIGMARVLLDDAGGIGELEQSLRVALEHGSPFEIARVYNNLGAAYMRLGRLEGASSAAVARLELAERFGLARSSAEVDVAGTDFVCGCWEQAGQRIADLLASGQAPPFSEHILHGLAALLRLARDDIAGAASECERALGLVRAQQQTVGVLSDLRTLLCVRAQIAMAEGRRATANELADAALSLSGQHLDEWAAVELALLLTDLGRSGDVLVEEANSRPADPWFRIAAAIVCGDLGHAADRLAEMGASPFEAAVRLRLAAGLMAEDLRPEADEQLHKALAFYHAVGATRYIRAAEALLATAV